MFPFFFLCTVYIRWYYYTFKTLESRQFKKSGPFFFTKLVCFVIIRLKCKLLKMFLLLATIFLNPCINYFFSSKLQQNIWEIQIFCSKYYFKYLWNVICFYLSFTLSKTCQTLFKNISFIFIFWITLNIFPPSLCLTMWVLALNIHEQYSVQCKTKRSRWNSFKSEI